MKKNLLAIFAMALMFAVVSCDPAPPPPPPKKPASQQQAPGQSGNPPPPPGQSGKPAPPPQQSGKPAPPPQQQGNWKPGQQTKPITDGVAETLDYGASVGRAYNNSKTKIQNINDQHNRELEDAMRE